MRRELSRIGTPQIDDFQYRQPLSQVGPQTHLPCRTSDFPLVNITTEMRRASHSLPYELLTARMKLITVVGIQSGSDSGGTVTYGRWSDSVNRTVMVPVTCQCSDMCGILY